MKRAKLADIINENFRSVAKHCLSINYEILNFVISVFIYAVFQVLGNMDHIQNALILRKLLKVLVA